MDFADHRYYINRELSWLEFNNRVLEEAQDKSNLLMERLKFLAITASNMDEFYMVRVSGLMELAERGYTGIDPSGMTPVEQLAAISRKVHEFAAAQASCLTRSVLPALERENIVFLGHSDLNNVQLEYIRRYFVSTIFPILTPMAIDQSRPFPLLNNKSLNLIVEVGSPAAKDDYYFAVVQVPTVIQRIIELPSASTGREFIFLEDIISEYIGELFKGYKVISSSLFRITRDSDMLIDEEDTEDLLYEVEKSIKKRKWGEPVRLEVEKNMPQRSKKFLRKTFQLEKDDIFEINGVMDLTVWMSFYGYKGLEHLKDKPLPPAPNVDFMGHEDCFEVIREKDVLVHHPYESFDCVVNFIKSAASDPQVLAIKQTLYRVSGNSPVVSALISAAENGKQVTVLVELKARFDEENNILWAKKLEKSGCHVVYGLVGLKTHCKICLVVRKEDDGIRRYVHLGTGNYNDSTARIYTDIGFFTCKETFGQDVSALFNVLTGYSVNNGWNKIVVAPVSLRETFMKYIENETKNAGEGKDAVIVAKLNSLVDVDIIKALYAASAAGVRIKLLVRGICCLRSGVEGVSENITVMSIVDRFLEHSRIYYFENAGKPRIFLSSADWMPRNLDRRVEVAFPVENAELKEKIVEILDLSMSDTIKLRVQQPDGSYERIDRRGKEHIQSQVFFHKLAMDRINAAKEEENKELFKPVLHKDTEAGLKDS